MPHRDPRTVQPVVGYCTNYATVAIAGAEPSEKVLSGKANDKRPWGLNDLNVFSN